MKIEFLYFKDCPGYLSTLHSLEKITADLSPRTTIEKIEITSEKQARQYRFLGSPSIRINGRDIEGGEEDLEYGLKCRIYSETGSGMPSEKLIRQALQAAGK
ncbi:MAG: DUF2703 domain-containing protein [Nitrospinaceae bacterium]|nr:DUF2703 domain-containing protein [Nitrospinaceae bacterium]NIR54945.1 DUF2703 domain-containing protein [Nitrospinaceae bacterium]NIT82187.1 DUF2703 domain-containing protein [Nitrospinaceae bacterium]NIX34574.1 DUF2703 domain-containing protein [Nitrospinaceae bacterium]NIY15400.1 DUF2703 domain-containing protein [Nitrospinaceae bacterium]